MKKKIAYAIAFSALAILTIASMVIAAPGTKVDVCHYDKDSGTYRKINISDNAWDTHIAHGDAAPGEPVPTMPSYKFDSECVPVPILDVTGRWTGRSGLVGNLAYNFYMDLAQASDGSVTGTIVYTNYSANRIVTGNLVGNILTITTADASYWATVSGTASNSYFYGTGTDKNGSNVALEAWK